MWSMSCNVWFDVTQTWLHRDRRWSHFKELAKDFMQLEKSNWRSLSIYFEIQHWGRRLREGKGKAMLMHPIDGALWVWREERQESAL